MTEHHQLLSPLCKLGLLHVSGPVKGQTADGLKSANLITGPARHLASTVRGGVESVVVEIIGV